MVSKFFNWMNICILLILCQTLLISTLTKINSFHLHNPWGRYEFHFQKKEMSHREVRQLLGGGTGGERWKWHSASPVFCSWIHLVSTGCTAEALNTQGMRHETRNVWVSTQEMCPCGGREHSWVKFLDHPEEGSVLVQQISQGESKSRKK